MTKEQLKRLMLKSFIMGQNHGFTYVAEGADETYMQEWQDFNDFLESELNKLSEEMK